MRAVSLDLERFLGQISKKELVTNPKVKKQVQRMRRLIMELKLKI
jgi:hypothetical protein